MIQNPLQKLGKKWAVYSLNHLELVKKENCLQNAHFQLKIAPEGREHFWGRIFFGFEKEILKS